jgi:hypothetical protein
VRASKRGFGRLIFKARRTEAPGTRKDGRVTTKKRTTTRSTEASAFDQARDELFSHILRCGVIEALPEHQKDWFDDTMQYVAERYPELRDAELIQLRTLGERYCQPVQRRGEPVGQLKADSVAV